MTCTYCGTGLPTGAMFCGECGRAVAGTVVQKPEQPEPALDPAPAVELVELHPPVSAAADDPGTADDSAADDSAAAEPSEADLGVSSEPDEPVDLDEPEKCVQCGSELEQDDIFCGECGFVRQPAGAARPRDTLSLDPFPWGAPLGSEGTELRGASAPTFDDDIDETRIVDRSVRGDRFVLQFSTGESVSVTGTGLLGRNPAAEPGEFFDSLVTISDPGKSVSKTHLEFGQDGGTFWISDRYSGNGTVARQPDSQPRRCEAGKRYRVARGTRVDIGEQFFIIS